MLTNISQKDIDTQKLSCPAPLFVKLLPRKQVPNPEGHDDNEKGNQCNFDESPSKTFADFCIERSRSPNLKPLLATLKQRQFEANIPGLTRSAPNPSLSLTKKVARTKAVAAKRCERCRCSKIACKECKNRPLSASARCSTSKINQVPIKAPSDLSKGELSFIKTQFSRLYENRQTNPLLKPIFSQTQQHFGHSLQPQSKLDNSFNRQGSLGAKASPLSLTLKTRPSSGRFRCSVFKIEAKPEPSFSILNTRFIEKSVGSELPSTSPRTRFTSVPLVICEWQG